MGSRLVMFTDGLVDNRDRPFDVGIEQLASTLTALPSDLSATDLTDALLDALLHDTPSGDDIAVVTVQRTA